MTRGTMGKAARRRSGPDPRPPARRPGPAPQGAAGTRLSSLEATGRGAIARGDLDAALTAFAEAVKLGSRSADTHSDLGVLLGMRGQEMAAVVQFESALGLEPRHTNARNNLVKALETSALGAMRDLRWEDAASGYTRLCALRPDCATFHNNAGAALCELKRPDQALPLLRRAVLLDPGDASAYYNLAIAYLDLNDPGCQVALERAIALRPGYWDAHVNLGLFHYRMGQFDAAEDRFRHVLLQEPQHLGARMHLASMLRELGRLEECLEQTRTVCAAAPDAPGPGSDYLLARQSDPTASGGDLLADARAWAARFADGLSAVGLGASTPGRAFPDRDLNPNRRLRVGYVSADFHNHSVAKFIEPLLAAHDPGQVEVVAYAQGLVDETTHRLRAAAHAWHDTRTLDDGALAARIARDRIDILVDLGGHTGHNRLLCFARRPAPIQVTYCGYPGTTGLAAMDWRLTDEVADPAPAADAEATERLWRLPHGFLCYRPDGVDLPVASPPSAQSGVVTFGSFNNLAKLGPEVLTLWARILAASPGARLFMKSRALGDPRPQQRVRRIFEAEGVDPSRLDFLGYAPSTAAHLALYARVDVGLDPFPYNGTTTTCEALWMGVPVVTVLGQRHAGRVGASLLGRVGLGALVARDHDEYRELALALARDAAERARLRGALRGWMTASPLMSPGTLARDVELAYRHFWRDWLATATTS
jgi:predicted O-linked N-acetylglucosamine transferase (SPINDLY family)